VSQTSDANDESLIHLPMAVDRRSLHNMEDKIFKQSKRHWGTRFVFSKADKDEIACWKRSLDSFLVVFNVRSIGSVGNL
jgi:hypothetical protein